jgi:hypothetical protein
MRPGTEPDNAQNQRRENSDIEHCIDHAFPPLKADCSLYVLIRRRPEVFPAILLWGVSQQGRGGFPGPLVEQRDNY